MRAEKKCNEKAIFHGTNFHMQTSLNVYFKNFHFHFSPWHRSLLLFNVCALVAEADTREISFFHDELNRINYLLGSMRFSGSCFLTHVQRPHSSWAWTLINDSSVTTRKRKHTKLQLGIHNLLFGALAVTVVVLCLLWSLSSVGRASNSAHSAHTIALLSTFVAAACCSDSRKERTDDIIGEYKISTQLATYESKALFFPLSIAFAIAEPTGNVSSRLSTRRGLESKSNFN